MERSYSQLLRRHHFRTVVGGEFVSLLGDGVYAVALAWLILTVSSPRVLAVTLVCLGVPRGLLLLVGGAMTDRLSPRFIMFYSHVFRFVLVAALAMVVATEHVHPWEFYAISASFGVADAFFWPASKAILPSLVSTQELAAANALNAVAEQTPTLLGPLLGGALVALFGVSVALLCDAGTFAVAALTVLAAPKVAAPEVKKTAGVRATWREIQEGLRYARSRSSVRTVLVVIAASALAYSGLFGVGLPRLAQTFPEKSFGLGLMYSCWGLGQLAGASSAARTGLPVSWGRLIIAVTFAEGTTFALLGFVANLAVVAVALTALGFAVAYTSDVALPTWLHATTPPTMLGRVSSLLDVPRVTLEPISMILMATLAVINVRLPFFAAAFILLAAGCFSLANKSTRSLQLGTGPND